MSAPLAQAAQVRAVGAAFLRLRPLLVAPVVLGAWALMAAADVPRARLAPFIAASSLMLIFFVVEALVVRRRALSERWLATSLTITLAGLGAGCALTGGVASPLVPMLLAPTVTAFAAFGRARVSWALLAGLVLVGAALLAGTRAGRFTALPPLAQGTVGLGALLLCGALLKASVAGLSDVHARASDALGRLREDVLADARARAREQGSVGAKVAHELKNPLAAIKGLVQLLQPTASDERARKRFAVVAAEIDRMETILRDYLSFARPLAELAPVDVDLARVVGDALAILEARAATAGVALDAEGPPLPLRLDPRRLTEALLNVVGNAIEATPAGGRVLVRWVPVTGGGARLAVRDGGPGVPPDELARLGEPYRTTKSGGTGLGVALARAALVQHGGALRFASEAGAGVTAILELPAAPPGGTHG